MLGLVPVKQLEIQRSHPYWSPPTFYWVGDHIVPLFSARAKEIACILLDYQHSGFDNPLIIGMRRLARHNAGLQMTYLASAIATFIKDEDGQYTIDWWSRTPSDVGAGDLVIAFRVLGLYEMSRC